MYDPLSFQTRAICFRIFSVDCCVFYEMFFSLQCFYVFVVDHFRNVAGERTMQRVPLCDEFFCWSHLELNRFSRFLDEHFVFCLRICFAGLVPLRVEIIFCFHGAFLLAK